MAPMKAPSVFAPRVRRWIFRALRGLVEGKSEFDHRQAVQTGRLRLHGDPKGQDKVQADENTAY